MLDLACIGGVDGSVSPVWPWIIHPALHHHHSSSPQDQMMLIPLDRAIPRGVVNQGNCLRPCSLGGPVDSAVQA